MLIRAIRVAVVFFSFYILSVSVWLWVNVQFLPSGKVQVLYSEGRGVVVHCAVFPKQCYSRLESRESDPPGSSMKL